MDLAVKLGSRLSLELHLSKEVIFVLLMLWC
jgi:hypothetical protein